MNQKAFLFNINFVFFQFGPSVILLSFCFSMNSDLSMLLRSRGVFGTMLITHDLRLITGNPRAQLNHLQKELLKLVGEICIDKAKSAIYSCLNSS